MTDSTPVPNRPDPAEAAAKKRRENEKDGDNRVMKDHIALKNQSSVKADDYPAKDRKAQSLVTPKKD